MLYLRFYLFKSPSDVEIHQDDGPQEGRSWEALLEIRWFNRATNDKCLEVSFGGGRGEEKKSSQPDMLEKNEVSFFWTFVMLKMGTKGHSSPWDGIRFFALPSFEMPKSLYQAIGILKSSTRCSCIPYDSSTQTWKGRWDLKLMILQFSVMQLTSTKSRNSSRSTLSRPVMFCSNLQTAAAANI